MVSQMVELGRVWFNSNYNSSTKLTPFRALYGRDPPQLLKGTTLPSAVEEVNWLTQDRGIVLNELKPKLVKAQDHMRVYANNFTVDDCMYLKLQSNRLKSLVKKINEKLRPRFYGPYQINKVIRKVAYFLEHTPDSKIHHVFHVSLLKKAIAPSVQPQPLPQMLAHYL